MTFSLLKELRQPAVAFGDSLQLAKTGHLQLWNNQEMLFNTVDSPVIDVRGLNSLMFVVSVTAAANLTFIGFYNDPHALNSLSSPKPQPTNTVITGGPATIVWSWGAFTTLGGGPNQDTTFAVWEFLTVEVTEGGVSDTFMTVDLFAGKR